MFYRIADLQQFSQLRDDPGEMLAGVVGLNGLLILPDLDKGKLAGVFHTAIQGVGNAAGLSLGSSNKLSGEPQILIHTFFTDQTSGNDFDHILPS